MRKLRQCDECGEKLIPVKTLITETHWDRYFIGRWEHGWECINSKCEVGRENFGGSWVGIK